MQRIHDIVDALYHVIRLRFSDPRLSRCMVASLLVVLATVSPLARIQSHATAMSVGHQNGLILLKQITSAITQCKLHLR